MPVKERAESRNNNPSSASNIIRRVEESGAMSIRTLTILSMYLDQMKLKHHVAVEIQSGVLLKTIDNEVDAQQTIKNIQEKLAKK